MIESGTTLGAAESKETSARGAAADAEEFGMTLIESCQPLVPQEGEPYAHLAVTSVTNL